MKKINTTLSFGFTKLEWILFICVVLLIGFFCKSHLNNKIITPTSPQTICARTQPYNNPPEFTRALSLVIQRYSESNIASAKDIATLYKSFLNCIDIKYTDSNQDNAEGYFIFDNNSDLSDLKIYVNSSYKDYDDILTAVLLSHELAHARQKIDKVTKDKTMSCIDNEIDAFSSELAFVTYLNDEEWKSLYSRLSVDPNRNTAYSGTWQIIQIYIDTANCNNANTCKNENTMDRLRSMVVNNPFYQNECSQ